MTDQLPSPIRDFYHHIRSLEEAAITKLPNFIDLQANERLVQHPQLVLNGRNAARLQDDYPRIQLEMADFLGRNCLSRHCPQPGRHIHSIQASGVLEVKGIPGVQIYPKLFVQLMNDLRDEILLEKLRESIKESGQLPASFTLGEGSQDAFPPRVKRLVEEVLSFTPKVATVSLSNTVDTPGLKQCEGKPTAIMNLSMRSDAILVVGREAQPGDDLDFNHLDGEDAPVDDESWQDLVALDSGEEDALPSASHGEKQGLTPEQPKAQAHLAAIRLRAGDVVVFSGHNTATWHGIAKLVSSTAPSYAEEWPFSPTKLEATDLQQLKDLAEGKRIEVEIF